MKCGIAGCFASANPQPYTKPAQAAGREEVLLQQLLLTCWPAGNGAEH
jgi:hypothetical protein